MNVQEQDTRRPAKPSRGLRPLTGSGTPAKPRLARRRRAPGPAERPRIELPPTEAGSLLEMLLENSPDAIYFKDLQSRFHRTSKSLRQTFRLPDSEDMRGKTDFDFFTEEHARAAYEDEQTIIRTGQPILAKLEKETHPGGRITWALTSKTPWRDQHGNILGTFGISRDVTALKVAEDKLAAERELLRTLLDNLPDAIYFKDPQSRFLHVSRSKVRKAIRHSPKLQSLLAEAGVRPDSPADAAEPDLLVGLTDFDFLTDEHAQQAFEDEQQITRTGQPIIDKLEKQTHLDGSVTWSLSTKMPWRDKQGATLGIFGLSRDVTALKQAEAELQGAHQRLVEASRLAGMAEVATDVLHNVGNTLNSINVSCSLAIDRVKQYDFANLARIPQLLRQNAGRLDHFLTADPQGKHLPDYLTALTQTLAEQQTFLLRELNQLRDNVEHVNQIISMQQTYARVAGVTETVEVCKLVDDALQINAEALERHKVRVCRETQPVSPILADKHKILQILVNLIRNAKYAVSEADCPDKLLTLRLAPGADNQVCIQVIDNGVGIPPENLTRIFSHGFTTRRGGHGFGLHSSALAAHDLGGALSVHSDGLGKGATFTLVLPLQPPATAP